MCFEIILGEVYDYVFPDFLYAFYASPFYLAYKREE